MRFPYVIFDMDGTTLDTLQDLTDSANAVLTAAGYSAYTVDEIRSFVGNGIRVLVDRMLPPDASMAERDRIFDAFIAHYKLHCADKTAPYAGILPLLARLRAAGVRIALLSNKAHAAVGQLCDQYFPGLFHDVAGEREDEGIPKKPDPAAVHAMMRAAGFTAEKTVYVGDSEVDVATARNAGVAGVFVTWGFRSRETLRTSGAEVIFDTPEAVGDYILGES